MDKLVEWIDKYKMEYSRADLYNIKGMYLCDFNITECPKEISILKQLTVIRFYKCNLTEIQPEIMQLINLTDLGFYGCKGIKKIPHTIINLKKLKTLDFTGNKIKSLPVEISQLDELKSLYLTFNKLTDIPKEFSAMKKLKYLDVDHNRLTKIPINSLPQTPKFFINYNDNFIKIPNSYRNGHTRFAELLRKLKLYIIVWRYYIKWRANIVSKYGPKNYRDVEVLQKYFYIMRC